MILKRGTFAAFAQRVRTVEKRVVIYGAGVIGETVAPYWLHEYQLDEAVMCFVDADIHKQGTTIRLASRDVPVTPLTVLTEQSGNYILLITVSAFEPIVRSLEQLPGTEDAEAYFLPIMLLDIAHAPKEGGVIRTSNALLIPKKIHYTWFSGEPIPAGLQTCIDTWKRFCPDYEIIRWDTSNYDVSRHLYTRQAYALQKWGFIADVARLEILYEIGGIYLDVDVELIRALDALLYQPAFCGVEKWGTKDFPSQINVDLIDRCNYACIHCAYSVLAQEKKLAHAQLSKELNKKLVDEVRQFGINKTQQIRYVASGEPFLHPDIMEILDYAVKNSGVFVTVTTNGSLVNEQRATQLLEMGVGLIDFSLDAFSEETYETIRLHGKLEKVSSNILFMLKKRREGNYKTKIVVSFVVQEKNQREKADFERYWKEQGVDYVIFRKLHSVGGKMYQKEKTGYVQPCVYPWERICLKENGHLQYCPNLWEEDPNLDTPLPIRC